MYHNREMRCDHVEKSNGISKKSNEPDVPGLFQNAKLYISEIETRYLTGEAHRKVLYHLYTLPQVTTCNEKRLLHDGEVFDIDGIRVECFLVPGHTWGHMVYLVDEKYLFTGDTLCWFGADGGYSFISALAEDNKLAVKSLALLEKKLKKTRAASAVHYRPHRLDRQYGVCLCAQK